MGIPKLSLNDWLPNSADWVVVTLLIGVLFTLLAVLVFAAGAIATFPALGVHTDFDNFWEAMNIGLFDMAQFRYAKAGLYGPRPHGLWRGRSRRRTR